MVSVPELKVNDWREAPKIEAPKVPFRKSCVFATKVNFLPNFSIKLNESKNIGI